MQTAKQGQRQGVFKNLNGDVCRFVFIEIAIQRRRRCRRWRWSRCRRCLYLSTNVDDIYEHIFVCIFRSQILKDDDNSDDDVAEMIIRWQRPLTTLLPFSPSASGFRSLSASSSCPFPPRPLSRCLPLRQLLLLLKCNANNKVAVHIYAICHAILFKHTESHRRRIEAQACGRGTGRKREKEGEEV